MVKENVMKETEIGLLPEDWEVKALGSISEKIMVGIASAATHAYTDKGVPMFRNQNIKPNYLDTEDILFLKAKFETSFKNKRLKAGDLLTARTGYPGTTSIVPKEFEGSQSFTTLITRLEQNSNAFYIGQYMNSEKGIYFFETNQIGGGQKNVNAGVLFKMLIPLPPLLEQDAIAEALSDADAWIESQEQLIAKKRLIKQGAMQELLTPKEEWEVKRLGEICEIKKGQMITSSVKVHGNIPVIAGGKTPAYYHNKPNRNGKTITISASGASAGYVGFHENPIFASDCSTIIESERYSIEYIYYFLLRNQDVIYSFQTGGAQPHIHPKDIEPMKVGIPSLAEQSIIAATLSDMDAELDALEAQLTKARQIKLGMMRELLTGKTRLV